MNHQMVECSAVCELSYIIFKTNSTAFIWFKHILFRRKQLGAAYNVTMPSPELHLFAELFHKELRNSSVNTCN